MLKGIKQFYKVIVIGDPIVGARSLLTKLSSNQFEEETGVSILKDSIEIEDRNVIVNLAFWRIAGQLQISMRHRPYFSGADGVIFVFDVTRSRTFSNIKHWYINAVQFGLSEIPRILIGNKVDLKDKRKIILPMAEHLSQKLYAPYFETSALTGENVKKAFQTIAELVYRTKVQGEPWEKGEVILNSYDPWKKRVANFDPFEKFEPCLNGIFEQKPKKAFFYYEDSVKKFIIPRARNSNRVIFATYRFKKLYCPECGSTKIKKKKKKYNPEYISIFDHSLYYDKFICRKCQYTYPDYMSER